MPGRGEIIGAGWEGPPGAGIAAGKGVALRAGATPGSLAVVAAVATGAAEALRLRLEPSVRLQTIAVEAAGNVVAHAYPQSPGGPLEIQICRQDGWSGDERQPCVQVRVRDRGVGVQHPPSGGHPPGLGLSMISSLAESYELESGTAGGTSLAATIVPDEEPSERREGIRGEPDGSCELEFADDAFLQPVLGRALAAQVGGDGTAVDRLGDAIQLGDAIAELLEQVRRPGNVVLRFRRALPAELKISVGPLLAAAAERLRNGLQAALCARIPTMRVSTEPAVGGGAIMRVTLPV